MGGVDESLGRRSCVLCSSGALRLLRRASGAGRECHVEFRER